jgi:hypothetical protein
MKKIDRRGFLKYVGLVLPFALLPDTCGRTMALVCPPEKLKTNNVEVTDKEKVNKNIPKAMQFQSTGMTEEFKLKYFILKTEILFSVQHGVYMLRGTAFPYSPFYEPKYFTFSVDLNRYHGDRHYKMKTIHKAEEALLKAYRRSPKIKFYRRTA